MNCWDCAHLGRCQRASKRVKSCSAYRPYDYNEKGVSFENVAKLLGISARTLYRRLKQDESAVLEALQEKGKTFQIIRTEKGVRAFKENKGDEK